MPAINTADLIGPALDWAVAKAANIQMFDCNREWPGNYAVTESTQVTPAVIVSLQGTLHFEASLRSVPWSPSNDWSQAGPIIEKHLIEISAPCARNARVWHANWEWGPLNGGYAGPTPLIAACRAIVAAKLGDTVTVPDELA